MIPRYHVYVNKYTHDTRENRSVWQRFFKNIYIRWRFGSRNSVVNFRVYILKSFKKQWIKGRNEKRSHSLIKVLPENK